MSDDIREQVWRNLQNSIYKSYVLNEMIVVYQKYDRILNVILAIASSSSLGAWAIFNVYPFLWSSIIATSQIITVLKPIIPMQKYLSECKSKYKEALELNHDFEKLWYKIQHDQVSEKNSVDEFFKLRKRMNLVYLFTEDMNLHRSKKINQFADAETKTYFKLNYNQYQDER